MELAKVEVRLSGSVANTVVRVNVTPAELMLLRLIHGDECIASIEYTGKERREHADELDRLRTRYKTENTKPLFDRLFPGLSPTLPTSFKEVGYEVNKEGQLRPKERIADEVKDEVLRKMRRAALDDGATKAPSQTVNYDEPNKQAV